MGDTGSGKRPVLLGVLGNRSFFPDEFVRRGAELTAKRVREILGDAVDHVDLGAVETYDDARRAALAAQAHRRGPDGGGALGVLVSMYNFSDECGIRDFLRLADLGVPVLVHTEPDARGQGAMGQPGRRDGACGRFSVCNALRHIGHPYTRTTKHCEAVDSKLFADDLTAFLATCRLADTFRPRGRGARVGLVGAAPDAFQTMTTASTELLGHLGVQTVGMTLLELDRRMAALGSREIAGKLEALGTYVSTAGVPAASLEAIARLCVILDRFVEEQGLDGLAIRCWTEMEQYRIGGETGVVPCTCMSMLSERMLPAACETDLGGWTGMYMLQLATGLAPGLADWNNMYKDNDDEIDLFHCGPWPTGLLREGARMAGQQIVATDPAVGAENTWGTLEGDLIPGTCGFLRPCTNAREGEVFLFGGVGTVRDDRLETFGTKGRLFVPRLQELLAVLTDPARGVEHHVPFVVGDRRRIALAMQAVRQAVPYMNHAAGRNARGAELIRYHEHDTVREL